MVARGVRNWTYKEVVKILHDNGFESARQNGSHEIFVGIYNGKKHQVTVPHHSQKAILPRTMSSIIRQSGMPKSAWVQQ